MRVIIPGKSLVEVGKIPDDDDQTISITVSDWHALFDLGHQNYIRVLEEYINYNRFSGGYKTGSRLIQNPVIRIDRVMDHKRRQTT